MNCGTATRKWMAAPIGRDSCAGLQGALRPPVQSDGIQLDELWREDWLVAMPSGHRLADMETIPIDELAGENFITAHPEFGPGCHAQSQAMFLAAGIQPRIIARAFRRSTMAILVYSGAGVTLLPGSFAGVAMDGIVRRGGLSRRRYARRCRAISTHRERHGGCFPRALTVRIGRIRLHPIVG